MTRKKITRLIKYIINKIMNGFLMKYDKNMVLTKNLYKILLKANKICAYPLKFVSGRVR